MSGAHTNRQTHERENGASAMRDARGFCRAFFDFYYRHHRYSGIATMAPRDVDHSRADEIVADCKTVIALAHERHSGRFIQGSPAQQSQPGPAWIHPPTNTPSLLVAAH